MPSRKRQREATRGTRKDRAAARRAAERAAYLDRQSPSADRMLSDDAWEHAPRNGRPADSAPRV